MINKNKLKKLNRHIFFSMILAIGLICASAVGFFLGWKQIKRDILIILNFHGVCDRQFHQWEISKSQLDKIIVKLKSFEYKPLSPFRYKDWRNGLLVPKRRFLITFDDGIKSSAEEIKYLYKQYKIESAFFIVTNFIDKPTFVSKSDLRDLSDNYHTKIGVHGKRHYEYTKIIAENGNLLKEITEAQQILASCTNKEIDWCAYPFGAVNASVTAVLASSTIKNFFTIKGKEARQSDNRFLIPRLMYLSGGASDIETFNINDWAPPKNASRGSLAITLSTLVLFIGLAWLLRGFSLIKVRQKYIISSKSEEEEEEEQSSL